MIGLHTNGSETEVRQSSAPFVGASVEEGNRLRRLKWFNPARDFEYLIQVANLISRYVEWKIKPRLLSTAT